MAAEVKGFKGPRIGQSYYSWAISAAGFCTQLACVFCLATLGISMASFSAGINTSPENCAIISSVFGVTYGGFGVFWGWLADKVGIRYTVSLSGLGAAVTMVLFGFAVTDVVSATVVYGFTGFFCAGLSSALIPKLVCSWFHSTWMGKSLAVVTAGGTIAGFLAGFMVPAFILGWDWRGAFIGMGVCVLVLATVMFLVVRNDPKKLGIIPFGTPKTEIEAAMASVEDQAGCPQGKPVKSPIKEVIRRPMVWKMGVLWMIYMAGMYADSTYQTNALQMFGWSLVIAGAVGSFYRLGQCVGAFIWAPLGDIFARKYILLAMGIAAGAMFVINGFVLQNTGNPLFGEATPFVMIVALGLTYAFVPVLNSQMSEVVEPELLGTASGLALTISLVGSFFGPLAASAIVTATGSWGSTFVFSGICTVIVGLLAVVWLPKTGGRKYGNPFLKKQGDPTLDR